MSNSRAIPLMERDDYYFTDNGCNLAPHCLSCPLPQCKYDTAPGDERPQTILRRALIESYGQRPTREIARALGLAWRTVHRYRSRAKATAKQNGGGAR